jgi:hypothetical protein
MKVRRLLHIFVLTALLLSLPAASFAQVSIGVAVNIGPPPLPVYAQPICPGANYIWTPGYWAWNGYDYYWVPGTWVLAPTVGLLWTPGWWGWGSGGYVWNAGYWGPHIGFYGGVNYGFGYYGTGYEGGYWRGNSFYYNTAVSRVNTTVIRNVYVNKTVVNNVTVNRVSYNGGRGGITARPTAQEETALKERRMGPVNAQVTHQNVAQQDRGNFFKSNHGVPETAALARPAASVNDFRRNAAEAKPVTAPSKTGTVNQPEHPAARSETRPAPAGRPENNVRPGLSGENGNLKHTEPTQRSTSTTRPSPETRPTPTNRPDNTARTETRPTTQQHTEISAARTETKPEPQQQPAHQPKLEPQQQAHNAAQSKPEPQTHSEPQTRPTPQSKPEPQQQAHNSEQARPGSQHTQPQARPAPQPKPESQAHPSKPHDDENPHR